MADDGVMAHDGPMTAPRPVAVIAFAGAQTLDFAGPLEALAIAERLRPGSYARSLVTPDGEPFVTSSGLRITPDGALTDLDGPIDTVIVAGGSGVSEVTEDAAVVAAVGALSRRARRTASVCTGAFVLAATGLLDGRRAATHWASADRLADAYPLVDVDSEPIFVRDTRSGTGGDVWTSAGVTAGIDLTLALIEDDLGADVALAVARWLVMFAKRPGGQAQFSRPLAAQTAERRPLREAQEHVQANPAADLSVDALALRANMSSRNFARAFARDVGITPAAYVETVRLERAKGMLETSGTPVEAIAETCGFGTPETLRRAFARRLGVSPSQYRDRFNAHAEAA